MKRWSLAAVVLLAACSGKPTALEILGSVPAFTLQAHTGAVFASDAELRGRVWVADFIFTNCTGPCPRMTSQMRQVQSATKDLPELRLVTFTVDPARDTAEALAAYARRQQADERWYFLTGPQETLHHLKRYAFLLGSIDGQLNHSTRFVLVDRRSRIRAYYDTSEPASIQRLIADIRRLEKES
ncbi:MAG: SCO family protein [Acidobacteria bacterium]|nr:SCO family protein [Acidobacteriota bacterium]